MKILRTSRFFFGGKRRCILPKASRAPCRPACPLLIWFGSTMAPAVPSGPVSNPLLLSFCLVISQEPLGCQLYNLSKVLGLTFLRRRNQIPRRGPTRGPAPVCKSKLYVAFLHAIDATPAQCLAARPSQHGRVVAEKWHPTHWLISTQTSTFSSFRSRWTIPCECRCAIACAISAT